MRGFLLDTNIPSEMSRRAPNPRVQAWLMAAHRESTYVSVITLGEIRKGFQVQRGNPRRAELERWFSEDVHLWFEERILPVTRPIAERWGVLEGDRQLQGQPLNTADGLIAATALEYDLTLVTRNVRDFEGLGVTILNPWES